MPQVSRNKSKYKGFKAFLYRFKYSFDGLVYAYKNEQSIWIHAVCSFVGIILGILLRITRTQWNILLITLAVILSIELLNTAIEAVVDMVTPEYNKLAKVAKDCGSAATFVVSITGAIISATIFIPRIINLLS